MNGFTLTEVMVVIGLVAIVGGLSLSLSMDDYRSYKFRSERDMFLAILHKARSQSMSNICLGTCTNGKPHGVAIISGHYVIFQGASYAIRDLAQDEITQTNYAVVFSGIPEVVFTELSGDATPSGDMTIADTSGHSSTVTITNQGRISWTN